MAEQRYERELVIEQRDPNELLAHPQNYRAHPAEQIEEIAKSLRALGQYRNVVARPDGTLLAGHGVVEAARKVGMKTVAVHIFEGTAEQEHLLMVADNELSRKAVDDEHALHGLLKQLQQEWGDLGGTGWDDDEHEQRLAELAAEDFDPDSVDFPEYDENLDTSNVREVTCPECGHEFPV
jgi:ParB-like chromosome segregation protein Spo0J